MISKLFLNKAPKSVHTIKIKFFKQVFTVAVEATKNWVGKRKKNPRHR